MPLNLSLHHTTGLNHPNLRPHKRLSRRQRNLVINHLRTTHSSHINRSRTLITSNNAICRLVTHAISPKIIDIPRALSLRRRSGHTILPEDVSESSVHLARHRPAIQQQDELVAAAERSTVELDFAVVDVVAPDADGAGCDRVLRDGEHGRVLLDGERCGVDGGHDVCHEQWRFECRPQTEVGDCFVVG